MLIDMHPPKPFVEASGQFESLDCKERSLRWDQDIPQVVHSGVLAFHTIYIPWICSLSTTHVSKLRPSMV